MSLNPDRELRRQGMRASRSPQTLAADDQRVSGGRARGTAESRSLIVHRGTLPRDDRRARVRGGAATREFAGDQRGAGRASRVVVVDAVAALQYDQGHRRWRQRGSSCPQSAARHAHRSAALRWLPLGKRERQRGSDCRVGDDAAGRGRPTSPSGPTSRDDVILPLSRTGSTTSGRDATISPPAEGGAFRSTHHRISAELGPGLARPAS